jgi:transposase
MRAYSKDLRSKVLEAVDRGMPRKEVAEVFGVSVPSIKRWLKRRRETGNVDPKPIPGPPACKKEALDAALPQQARLNPDLTLDEHCELFEEVHGIEVSSATMSRAFTRLRLPLKKVSRSFGAR